MSNLILALLIVQTTFTVVGAIAGMIAVRDRLQFDWAPRVFFAALIIVVIATGILDFYTRFNQYSGANTSKIEPATADWPLLTASDKENWVNNLKLVKFQNVEITIYYAKRDEDVAVGIGEAIKSAGWPKPYLIGDQVPLGIGIAANTDAQTNLVPAVDALQTLCEKQFSVSADISQNAPPNFLYLYIGRRSGR